MVVIFSLFMLYGFNVYARLLYPVWCWLLA